MPTTRSDYYVRYYYCLAFFVAAIFTLPAYPAPSQGSSPFARPNFHTQTPIAPVIINMPRPDSQQRLSVFAISCPRRRRRSRLDASWSECVHGGNNGHCGKWLQLTPLQDSSLFRRGSFHAQTAQIPAFVAALLPFIRLCAYYIVASTYRSATPRRARDV